MHSRLATHLLGVYRPAGAVSDLIWRHARLVDATTARAVPSLPLVDELAQFCDNETGEALGRLLPTTATLDQALGHGAVHVQRGTIRNRALSDASLAALSTGAASVDAVDEQQRRSARRAILTVDALAGGLRSADLDTLRLADAKGVLVDALIAGDLDDRRRALSLIEVNDSIWHDRCCDALIGVTTGRGVAVLDEHLAGWLVHSPSLAAEAARDMLVTDDRLFRRRRATAPALRELQQAGLVPTPAKVDPPRTTDRAMLDALRLTGSPKSEIAALVLNTKVAMTTHELAQLLTGAGLGFVQQFVTGSTRRSPEAGEVGAIVNLLGPDGRAALLELIPDSKLAELPWFGELVVELPVGFLDKVGEQHIAELHRRVSARLGDDPVTWEFALIMSEEWENNLSTLLDAATAMDQLN